MIYDAGWFRENVMPHLHGYKVEFAHFQKGDFGDLDRIELENDRYSVCVEFWGWEYLGIMVFDKDLDDFTMNVMIFPENLAGKEASFAILIETMLS
jgi:hypothetical protein